MTTDLKTLKDFFENETQEITYLSVEVFVEDLREEAIKWAKALEPVLLNPDKVPDSKIYWISVGQLTFIENFFNITEEELK